MKMKRAFVIISVCSVSLFMNSSDTESDDDGVTGYRSFYMAAAPFQFIGLSR